MRGPYLLDSNRLLKKIRLISRWMVFRRSALQKLMLNKMTLSCSKKSRTEHLLRLLKRIALKRANCLLHRGFVLKERKRDLARSKNSSSRSLKSTMSILKTERRPISLIMRSLRFQWTRRSNQILRWHKFYARVSNMTKRRTGTVNALSSDHSISRQKRG